MGPPNHSIVSMGPKAVLFYFFVLFSACNGFSLLKINSSTNQQILFPTRHSHMCKRRNDNPEIHIVEHSLTQSAAPVKYSKLFHILYFISFLLSCVCFDSTQHHTTPCASSYIYKHKIYINMHHTHISCCWITDKFVRCVNVATKMWIFDMKCKVTFKGRTKIKFRLILCCFVLFGIFF